MFASLNQTALLIHDWVGVLIARRAADMPEAKKNAGTNLGPRPEADLGVHPTG